MDPSTPALNEFLNPPREFSLLPFWFWNDELTEAELLRQIADFDDHGVYGFVIHPRVGLPRDTGWMSSRLLRFVRLAVEEAARREMKVVLYDEGMYPSGSSSGQVVASNPLFACRGFSRIELEEEQEPVLEPGHHLVAVTRRSNGQRIAVVDRPIDSVIRGLHYLGQGPAEETPPAADLLNPEAVACFIRLVYDRYFEAVGDHFGRTVIGMFTDEPDLLGRCQEREAVSPGTTGILDHVKSELGYDFTPHLPALFYDDEPEAPIHRQAYLSAVHRRLESTYYQPLSQWCEAHGVALMGHPAAPDDIALERYFHIPGQDIVWRFIEPGQPSALEGPQSTQGKCSSSAMIHLGRRRNSNECYGAYGHELTFEETRWIANWCFARGVNMLIPHAFYYSVRGPRYDERPPDVGPNSAWWDDYATFARYCRRLSWLNTDCRHVCRIAILGEAHHLPWRAAKICFQHQRDFNYIEAGDLLRSARVDASGIRIADMHYQTLVVDGHPNLPQTVWDALQPLADAGRVVVWPPNDGGPKAFPYFRASKATTPAELISVLDRLAPPHFALEAPHEDIRCRHVIKGGESFILFVNEGTAPAEFRLTGGFTETAQWLDPWHGSRRGFSQDRVVLRPFETVLLHSPALGE
jgi:hypothetical protein